MEIIFGISKSVREAASSVTVGALRTLGKHGRAKGIGERAEKYLRALVDAEAKRKAEQETELHKGLSRNVERS